MNKNDKLEKYRFMDSLEGLPSTQDTVRETLPQSLRSLSPGIMVCGLVTLSATLISEHYSAPVMLMCLLIGLAFHFLFEDAKIRRGIQFTSQHILKAGVALIGARILFSEFDSLGFFALAAISLTTVLILISAPYLGRLFGLDRELGLLIGGATAICGASAALAISSVMPASKSLERHTLTAVIGVTLMGTFAMVVYPVLLGILDYSPYHSGVIIGGSIHDVSQVVGAGYSVSEDAGDAAVLVKLIRVFMLLPILLALSFLYRNRSVQRNSRMLFIPPFLVGFILLAGMNSLGLMPVGLSDSLGSISKWLLVMAIAAVGLKTSMKDLFSLGYGPTLLVVSETAILFIFYCVLTGLNIV